VRRQIRRGLFDENEKTKPISAYDPKDFAIHEGEDCGFVQVSGTRSTLTCTSGRLRRSHRSHRAALPLPWKNMGEGGKKNKAIGGPRHRE